MSRWTRRQVLRGAGAAIALPFLPSALGRRGAHAAAPPDPARFVAVYAPCGAYLPSWKPEGEGSDWSLSPSLQPLSPYKDRLTVVTGTNATATYSEREGFHRRATSSWLTCTPISETFDYDELSNGMSIDQIIADRDHHHMRLPSVQVGVEIVDTPESPLKAHAGIYMMVVSWRGNTPLLGAVNPYQVWTRLVGSFDAPTSPRASQLLQQRGASMLDRVLEDLDRMQGRLDARDNERLDAYLTSLRELETRLASASSDIVCEGLDAQEYQSLQGRPIHDPALMLSLVAKLMECDLTRVATVMISAAEPGRVYSELGHTLDHHSISHHNHNPELVRQTAEIDNAQAAFLKGFLDDLTSATDAQDRDLLDNTCVLYGSGMGDGSLHLPDDLPMLYAGGAGGKLRLGKHIRADGRPLADLHLTLLQAFGHDRDSFADSGAPISELLV